MASNNKTNIIETFDFAGLTALIDTDVTTEQAAGFNLLNCITTQYVDITASGQVKSVAILVYNKVGGAGGGGGTSAADLQNAAAIIETTIGAAASTPLAGMDASATHALITIETADVRVRFDGVAPTATVGHLLTAPFSGLWAKELAVLAQFIRIGAVDADIKTSQLKPV